MKRTPGRNARLRLALGVVGVSAFNVLTLGCGSDDTSSNALGLDSGGDALPNAEGGDAQPDSTLRDASPQSDASDGASTDGGMTDGASADSGGRSDANVLGDSGSGDAPNCGTASESDAAGCVLPSPRNLVSNAGLDQCALGWTPFESAIVSSWDPLDSRGCPSSGSVGVANVDDGGINSGAYQCVGVSAGTKYNFGASFYLPATGPAGQAFLQIDWNTDPTCHGTIISAPLLYGDTSIRGTWQALTGSSVAPAGAHGAAVYLQIVQGTGSGFRPLFDHIYLSPAPALY